MVVTLIIPVSRFYGLDDIITLRHLNKMAKVTLATALIVAYGYTFEAFFGYFSADTYERFMIWNRMTGPYAIFYWCLILCNIITPQFLWSKKIRTSPGILWIISLIVNLGMWLERFVIVITSLHRDFLPSSWAMYAPTVWDWATYFGTIGFFMFMIFLFIAGLLGAIGGFGLLSWVSFSAWPLNVGGRPLISVPMFIPITFECTILLGGLTAAISMIVMNGLPSPYHPVFNVERFVNASRSKFFLCIESEDPKV